LNGLYVFINWHKIGAQFISTLQYFDENVFYIPVKFISKQAAAWFLFPVSFGAFSIQYTQSADQPHHILVPSM